MPVITGTGQFSVGRDCQIILVAQGTTLQIDNITSFEIDPVFAAIKIDRLDSVQMNAQLPKGGSGRISYVRSDSRIDDFFASLESTWYTQGLYNVGTIDQYITEANGQSAYQHTNIALTWKPGAWSGDQDIKSTINFMYDRRLKI